MYAKFLKAGFAEYGPYFSISIKYPILFRAVLINFTNQKLECNYKIKAAIQPSLYVSRGLHKRQGTGRIVFEVFSSPVKSRFIVLISKRTSIPAYQSYEIKSFPWTILWFRILEIFSVESIARLGVFMFQS